MSNHRLLTKKVLTQISAKAVKVTPLRIVDLKTLLASRTYTIVGLVSPISTVVFINSGTATLQGYMNITLPVPTASGVSVIISNSSNITLQLNTNGTNTFINIPKTTLPKSNIVIPSNVTVQLVSSVVGTVKGYYFLPYFDVPIINT